MTSTQDKMLIAAVLLIGGYIWYRGFGGAAKDVAKAAVNVAEGVVTGGTIGIGHAFGIQETQLSQCAKDKTAGKYWDASFSCPAKDYAKFVLTGK